MARINLASLKFTILIGLSFSVIVAFLILREVLLKPGIIESIDIQWNNYISMFKLFFHTWNFYTGGSNIVFVSQFLPYSLVLVVENVAVAQRLTYLVILSSISFNMFIVAFLSLKRWDAKVLHCYLGSLVGSFVYTVNPLLFSEIFHISFLWSYALFPLVYHFTLMSVDASSKKTATIAALVLSCLFAFMSDAWGMTVGVVLFLLVVFSYALLNGVEGRLKFYLSNVSLTILVMVLLTPLLSAYWLLPYLVEKPSEPVWDPFSVTNLFKNSQENYFANVLGLRAWDSQPFFSPSQLSPSLQIIWLSSTLILPVLAVSAILLRRDKVTFSLSVLVLFNLFLSKGVQPPLGEFYLWLSAYSPRIVPNQSFLFKYPYLFLANVALAYSLLGAIVVAAVFNRHWIKLGEKRLTLRFKSRSLASVVLLSFILVVAVAGYPLLTGNLNNAISPVQLPKQYEELNGILSSKEGEFRVMWLPESSEFVWSPNPHVNKIEYWGSAVPPLLYGWGIRSSPYTGFLGNMIYDSLENNRTQNVGKILSQAHVKYVVFHNDTSDSGEYNMILRNLYEQKDLTPIFSRENLFAFENTDFANYFQATRKIMFITGGLDAMRWLSSLENFRLQEDVLVFLQQQYVPYGDLAAIFESNSLNKTLLFYNNKSFDDFVLDTLNPAMLIAPDEHLMVFSPLSEWFKDSITSHLWTRSVLRTYEGDKYDFSLGKNLIYTFTKGARLNFQLEISSSGEHDVWARVLLNPDGGKVSFSIEGERNFSKDVETLSPKLEGFKWVHLDRVWLDSGTYEIIITNQNGFNAINVIALPHAEQLEEHRENLMDLVNRSNATVAYVRDKLILNTSTPSTKITLFSPKNSKYFIAFKTTLVKEDTTLSIQIGDQSFTLNNLRTQDNSHWRFVGPFYLEKGYNYEVKFSADVQLEIDDVVAYSTNVFSNTSDSLGKIFGNDGTLPYVLGYQKPEPTTFSLQINATTPFILAFREPYDELWQANASGTKLCLNAVTNGFFLKNSSLYDNSSIFTLTITYTPERYLQLGVKISIFSFFLVVIIAIGLSKVKKFV